MARNLTSLAYFRTKFCAEEFRTTSHNKNTANRDASDISEVTFPAALLCKAIALLRFQILQTNKMENKHLSQNSFFAQYRDPSTNAHVSREPATHRTKKPFKGKNYTRIFHISSSLKYQVLNCGKIELINLMCMDRASS